MYQLGRFELATQGFQANSALIGQLWVSYVVEFSNPYLIGGLSGGDSYSMHYYSTTGITATEPLGTSGTRLDPRALTSQAGDNTITFRGNAQMGAYYKVIIVWKGSVNGNCTFNATPASGTRLTALVSNAFMDASSTPTHSRNNQQESAATESQAWLMFYIKMGDDTSQNATLTITDLASFTIGGNLSVEVWITMVNPLTIGDGTLYT